MINALIVIYNKNICDSLSYNSINKYNKLNIIIFDNSSEESVRLNSKYCKDNNICYYTLNENVGLSKAYNYVIDKIELNDTDYLLILDDDTPLKEQYIDELFKSVKESTADIYIPIIISDNKIISPANVQFNCRIKMLKNIKKLDYKRISAINSGMLIKTSVFKKIKYNDKMFLEYIDHDFMKKVRAHNYKVKLIDIELNQNYSRFQYNDIKSEMHRFKIYLKDFKLYCKNCNNLIFYYISTIKYRIHEAIKYKNTKFIFIK